MEKTIPTYTCSQCGLAVIILDGQPPIKACKCDAVIYANASAVATGTSNQISN